MTSPFSVLGRAAGRKSVASDRPHPISTFAHRTTAEGREMVYGPGIGVHNANFSTTQLLFCSSVLNNLQRLISVDHCVVCFAFSVLSRSCRGVRVRLHGAAAAIYHVGTLIPAFQSHLLYTLTRTLILHLLQLYTRILVSNTPSLYWHSCPTRHLVRALGGRISERFYRHSTHLVCAVGCPFSPSI